MATTLPAAGALAGLRVIEMGSFIAGPFCGQMLGDLGADVIKIEPPGSGDPLRSWRRLNGDGPSLWWPIIGRNKRSITLDLRKAPGQRIARKLITDADILIENFRPGTLEKWELGYEQLSQLNPRLIMLRISGFGQDGPYREQAGFGSVGEAMGGIRYVTGHADRPPPRIGISIGDSLSALFGAVGVLAAVHARVRTGRGQLVDTALYESVLAVMECLVTEYDKAGLVRERSGTFLPGVAPSNVYPCADGRDIVIGANGDAVFRRLCEAMDRPELTGQFCTTEQRSARQEELDRLIAGWTSQRSSAAVLETMRRHGVPAGLIYRAPEMLTDPHFAARRAIVDVHDEALGKLKMQNVFPRLSDTPGEIRWTGPTLGQHNQEVFNGLLGMSESELVQLRQAGVI